MPVNTVQTQDFALAGPFHAALVIAAGCVLLGLFAWSLMRERIVIGNRTCALFALLRSIALLMALWMLLAPTSIRSQRTTTRRAVAVVVDVSGSMQTVDPPGGADDLRWELAASSPMEERILVAADRALAAAGLAEQRVKAATEALRRQQPERVVLGAAAEGLEALKHTRSNVQVIAERLNEEHPPGEQEQAADSVRGQAEQILQLLEGTEVRRLESLSAAVLNGDEAQFTHWREGLSDLNHRVGGIRQRLSELAVRVAELAALSAAPTPSQTVTADQQPPRLRKVIDFVNSLDENVLRSLRSSADIRHAAFDGVFTPVSGRSPAEALAQFLQRSGRSDSDAAEDRGPSASNAHDPPVTDIAAALHGLRADQRDQPLAAVFLLTDAAHNRPGGQDPRLAAAALDGTPVYVVPIGSTRRVRDVDLQAVSAPGVVMKDDDVVIEATVQAFECPGETCRVELLKNAQVVQSRDISFDSPTATQRVRFNTQLAEVGAHNFQVSVVPLAGELSESNNFETCRINVTRNHIDVLLADEVPRWEYRYLTQLFRRDPKVACDELLFHPRVIATGRRQSTQSFPSTVDEWSEYDVVILGDLSSEHLSVQSQAALSEALRERGGTLVLIAGEQSMPQSYTDQPLGDLLPVTKAPDVNPLEGLDGYSFHVTEEGWRHDALMITDTESSSRIAWEFINRNAPLYGLSAYRHARASAQTLLAAVSRTGLEANPDPARNVLMCWQPVGRGRVVYLASPETYRLRFLRGDRLHYRFWGQLLRWAIADQLAAGSELLRVRTDQPDYERGDPVQVQIQLQDRSQQPVANAELKAVAVRTDAFRQAVALVADESTPGEYRGTFERLPAGIYRVDVEGPQLTPLLPGPGQPEESPDAAASAGFTVHAPLDRELLDTRSDRALAQQIADASGGQVLPPTAMGEVLSLTNLEPIVTESTRERPLWVRWEFLWIVFGCLFVEWAVRKQMGLS